MTITSPSPSPAPRGLPREAERAPGVSRTTGWPGDEAPSLVALLDGGAYADRLRLGWRGCRRGVFAAGEIPRGTALLEIRGNLVASPNRLSLQIGRNEHLVDCGPIVDTINHSCSSNAYIDFEGLVMRAKTPIARGREVCINYCATEEALFEPFSCDCKSPNCYRYVAGYRHLSDRQKAGLLPELSPYLRGTGRPGRSLDRSAPLRSDPGSWPG